MSDHLIFTQQLDKMKTELDEVRTTQKDHSEKLEIHDSAISTHAEILERHIETAQQTRDAIIQVRDIMEAWNNTKGFFRVLGVIGHTLKWLAMVGAAIGAIVYFIKTGSWR